MRKRWGLEVFAEQRVQISAERYRVADVCILPLGADDGALVVRTPPLVCIEILSRDDRMSAMQERVDDYIAMKCAAVWIVDPWRRRVYVSHVPGEILPADTTLKVPRSNAEIEVSTIFDYLDEFTAAV